jgi:hypothetical protein
MEREIDEVRREVEQRVVAAGDRAPGPAAVVQDHAQLDVGLRRHPAGQLQALVEAAVEGDPGDRGQRRDPQRAGGVGRRRLLDERRQAGLCDEPRHVLVMVGRRADHDPVERRGRQQLRRARVR